MNKDMLSKTLIMGIVLLFFGISITPTIGTSNSFDDTTPPVTIISLDPPEPDGLNGWYVSDVIVTLNATDDISGVNITKYRINGGIWKNYIEPFILVDDGYNIIIEFYSVDNAGNQEPYKQISIAIDQTTPNIDIHFDYIKVENDTAWVEFVATATDAMSGMNRVDFNINGEILDIIYGPGPTYEWETIIDYDYTIIGLICIRNITDEYVTFLAIVISVKPYNNITGGIRATGYDNAGNNATDAIPPGPPSFEKKLFKWYTFPNDYEGYIGKYYIDAMFKGYPITGPVEPNNLNQGTDRLTNRIPFHTLLLRLIERFPLLNLLLQRLRI